jgi:hypothetical protein
MKRLGWGVRSNSSTRGGGSAILSSAANKLILFATVMWSGCSGGQDNGLKPVSISDPILVPMLQAIAAVDRRSLGFTPIPTNGFFSLKMVDSRSGCDAMLFINGHPRRRTIERMIEFRKTQNGYRWTGELEKHFGPGSFTDFHGTFQEYLVIQFNTEPVNDLPPNQIHVRYYGQNPRLAGRPLTLGDIRPFLEAWKDVPVR